MTRTIFVFVIPFLFLVACGSNLPQSANSQNSLNSDEEFRRLVMEAMPGFALNSRLLGRTLIYSEAYSIERTSAAVFGKDRDTVIADFIRRFETGGAQPFLVYFSSGSVVPGNGQYWKLDFAGCSPGQCLRQLSNSSISTATKAQHDNYYPLSSSTDGVTVEVAEATLNGVDYQAILNVNLDAYGRVIKYSVSSYREALTAQERRLASQVSTSRRLRVPTARFVRNVPLGQQAETFSPSYISSDGVDALKGL